MFTRSISRSCGWAISRTNLDFKDRSSSEIRGYTRFQDKLKNVIGCAISVALLLFPAALQAAPNLILDSAPVTWNIIGLDSNNVTVGPQDFPVGVRVKNTGSTDATSVTATFAFTTAEPLINLVYNDQVTTNLIKAGGYADFYFTVRVTRSATAYFKTRGYTISVQGDGLGSPLTTSDTLFVEKLISQQSNDVLSLVGPPTVSAGETRQFILTATTQNGGRDQVEQFVNFPNTNFQIVKIQTTYSNPGVTIDRFYADACGWLRNVLPPDNTSCNGPDASYGAQAGANITVVYDVYITQTPTTPIHLTTLIMDVGGSFHYNTDFGLNVLTVSPPADLSVVKTAVDNPVEAGNTVQYLLTIVNPDATVAKDVVLTDTLPAGLTFVSATPPPTSGPNPLRWNVGDMAASSTLSFNVLCQTSCNFQGSLTNVAGVDSSTTDTNKTNNITSQTILVQDTTSPTITCPMPIVANADAGQCSRSNVTFSVTAQDNCTTVSVVSVPASGSTFPVGTTIVTSTATDSAGNKVTCTFPVTIVDAQSPGIICPPTIDLAADAMACSKANVTITPPTATDNCTTVGVTVTGTRSDALALNAPYPVGTTTITWKATDAGNRMTTCAQQVIIRDTTKPVIQCPSNITANADAGQCSKGNVTFTVTATDNCSSVTVVSVPPSGSTFPVGTTVVTSTATDSAGNTATCTFSVTINDNQLPGITCPATINVNAGPSGCSATGVTIVPPVTTDNCSTSTLVGTRSDALALNAPYPVGTTTITWKVTDASNNMVQCTQQVVVADVTPPGIVCPATINVTADPLACSKANVTIVPPVTTDNCSTVSLTGVRSDALALNAPYPVGTTTITWTVKDGANNMASCTQGVVVRDVTPPMITCPATVNVNASAQSCSAPNVSITSPTITSDNCSTASLTASRSDALAISAPYPIGTTTITWTVTDQAGNQTSCTQLVNVTDNTKPGIVCPATINVNASAQSCSAPNVNIVPPVTTDNCTTVSLVGVRSDNLALNAPYPLGDTTITWTVTDGSNNTQSCTQTVRVSDTTPPSITCGATVNVNAAAQTCTAANVSVVPPVTGDNCSTATLVGTRSDALPLSSPYPLGDTTITWTVTDGSGNQASCTQIVRVRDVTAPVITCPPVVNANSSPGICGANVNYVVTATDSCNTSITLVCTPPPGSLFPVGTTPVTCTATDTAGNQSSCGFNVVVTDNEKPAITCPTDIMTCMQNVVLGVPVTSDNCATQTLTAVRSDNLPLSSDYPPGLTNVVWTVTDNHGNATSCTQHVMIANGVLPTIMCPADVTVNALAGQCVSGPVQYPAPTVMDNCSTDTSNLTITYNPPQGSTFPLGESTVTITVEDPMHNRASCTFKVIVRDVTPPSLTCPANIVTSNSPGQCAAAGVTFQVGATDTCSNPVTVVATPPSGSTFPKGATTVNVSATDAAGNTANCSFTVTVNDTEKPTITCPAAISVSADAGQCQAVVPGIGTPVTNDNCSTSSVSGVRSDALALNAPYPVGTTVITWTVTDSAGNTASCTQNVTVRDRTAPSIQCPANIVVSAPAGACVSDTVTYSALSVSDNCSTVPVTVAFVPPSGSQFPIGTSTVTATATDAAGNQATCTFTVTVNDVTGPNLTCPPPIVVSNTPGLCGNSSVSYSATATDTCSQPVNIIYNPPSGSPFPVGTTTVNVTATDGAGNTSNCSFTVTVNDTQQPVIMCPAPIDIMADADQCEAAEVNVGLPTSSDNCQVTSVSGVRSDGRMLIEPYPVGVTTITWTVSDAAGNSASCQQTVTVRDTMMPTIQCPADMNVSALFGQCVSGPVVYDNPIVSDNCTTGPENLTVTFNPPSGSTFPVGSSTVTVTVMDPGGNTSTCTFKVNVRDITPPAITCPGNITVSNSPGVCGASSVTYSATATDTCSPPVNVVLNPPSGSAFPVGTSTVTATATDAAGNTAMCNFTVTVNDTQPPQITCPPAMVVGTSPGECQALAVEYSAQATDNCQGPVTVTFNPPSGSNLPVGVNTIQVTATDGAGNTSTCSFTVTVEDRDGPRLSCPDAITTATVPCEFDAIVPLLPPSALDPCGTPAVTGARSDNRPLTDRFPVGDTTVTWTATDSSNNQTSCSQLVRVTLSDCAPVCDGPDLVIMPKMFPTYKCSKTPSCKVKGWYVVTNIGTQSSGATNVCFYLSDDEILDPGDFQFKPTKHHRVPGLPPGGMAGVDLNGKAPKGVPVEGKYILAVVDCANVVVECREDNNQTADHPMPPMKKMK